LHTELHLSNLEKQFAGAVTEDDCWRIVRDAVKEYGFAHVRMQLGDRQYQERLRAATLERCWCIRIPLADGEYLNLWYQQQFAREPVLLVTTLAQVLQENLSKRAGRRRYGAREYTAAAAG